MKYNKSAVTTKYFADQMKVMNENLSSDATIPFHDKFYDGVSLPPAKEEEACTIAVIRQNSPSSLVSSPNVQFMNNLSTSRCSAASANASSLFQQTMVKLCSFSESTETENTESSDNTKPAKHALSPLRLQLCADPIVDESRKRTTVDRLAHHADSNDDTASIANPLATAEVGPSPMPFDMSISSPGDNPTLHIGNIAANHTLDTKPTQNTSYLHESLDGEIGTDIFQSGDSLHQIETEDEIDTFLQSIEKPILEDSNNEIHMEKKQLKLELPNDKDVTIVDELNGISVKDPLVASPVSVRRDELSDDNEVSKVESSVEMIESADQKVLKHQSKEESKLESIDETTTFSFYTPDARILLEAEKSSHTTANTQVESRAASDEKLKCSTTFDALQTILNKSRAATTPTSPNSLAEFIGKSKTPVSQTPPSSASSVGVITTPLSLAFKTHLSPMSSDNEAPTKPDNKDEAYEESIQYITAQIQDVVRSKIPSTTLGNVLAVADRRGIRLDIVTEIYKQERFNFSSEKMAQWEALALKTESKVGEDDSNIQEEQPSPDPVIQSSHHVMNDVLAAILPSPLNNSNAQLSPVQMTLSSPNGNDSKSPIKSEINYDDVGNIAEPSTSHSAIFDDLTTKNESIDDEEEQCSNGSSTSQSPVEIRSIAVNAVSPAEKFASSGSSLDQFVLMIKDAVRSKNPSQELGQVLAKAKTHHIPINPLVEVYISERMFVSSVSTNIDLSQRSAEEIDLSQKNTALSDSNDPTNTSDSFPTRKLSNTQLHQSQHLVNNSLGVEEADDYPKKPIDDSRENSINHHLEDMDEFFSRFGIDGLQAANNNAQQEVSTNEPVQAQIERSNASSSHDVYHKYNTAYFSSERNDSTIMVDDFSCYESQVIHQFSEHSNIADVSTLLDEKETMLHMQGSSLIAGFIKPIVPLETSPIKEKKNGKKERKYIKLLKIRPRENRRVVVLRDDLSGYLGYWRSPWEKNRARTYCYSSTRDTVDGVDAAAQFTFKRENFRHRHCFLSEKERTKYHCGYKEIDFYSLYEATTIMAEDQDIDIATWEYRDVRQRFLNEKSVESRNWFGSFEKIGGNDRVCHPVSRPSAFQMTMTGIPHENEWKKNWYTSWRTRRDNPDNLMTFTELEIKTSYFTENDKNIICERMLPIDESEDIPVCNVAKRRVKIDIGTLCPVRLKVGEHISKIHPDFITSLRRSRWRRKYISGVLFPRN